MSSTKSLPMADAIAELAGLHYLDNGLDEVVSKVADLAGRTVPGTEAASVSMVRKNTPQTAAWTSPLALELDQRQYDRGHGPCLDAAATGDVVSIRDMSSDRRWPDFAPEATERGVRSSLSIGMPLKTTTQASLNLYGTRTDAFDERSVRLGSTFVDYAAVAIANAQLYGETMLLAEQMRQAMQSRAVIDQAKGILIRDRHCTPEEAFGMLRDASTRSNRKLRDIARGIVESSQQRV